MPTLSEQHLQQDLAVLSNPDVKTAFASRQDVFRRLAPYHLLHTSDDVEARQTTAHAGSLDDSIRRTAASAQTALDIFQIRLKKEGDVEKTRLTAEQTFLESLAVRQDQITRQTAFQSSAGSTALQFRPTSAQTVVASQSGGTGTATGSHQNIPRPAIGSLAELRSSWMPVNAPSNPSQPSGASLQTGNKIERPLT